MQVALMATAATYEGCERFPGFGSAFDRVQLSGRSTKASADVQLSEGRFNISTHDYIYSQSCSNVSEADLTWGHSGTFSRISNTSIFAFKRTELFLEALTRSGQLFGRVLCPRVALSLGKRSFVPLQQIDSLCASLTFNNCETYYDALEFTDGGLRRSSSPSCSSTATPQPDGPLLRQTS